MSCKRNIQEKHRAEGIRSGQVCSCTKYPFSMVSLSVSSLVLVELKGRGRKKDESGNRVTKLVRSLQLHLVLSSAARMQRGDGMGKSQRREPFPALSLLQAALWPEPSGRGTEASY